MTDYAIREDQGNIAIVTLNRPDKLNAINSWMRAFIRDAVHDLRDRDDLRVLLIRARGRYFTAGVDLHEVGMTSGEPDKRGMMEFRRDYRKNFHLLHDEIEACEKPVVMAIQGPCLGLGVEMGGSCDFRLASEDAAFGLPEIDLGVIAGSGGVSRFTRLCGIGWSKWLSVAGEKIDADTARIAGFVQAVYPREGFEEKVLEFCRRLASRPAEAQGAAKLAVELAWDLDRTQARNIERLVNTPLMLRDNSEHVQKAFGKKPKT
jgi:enoyl-CoA hydratase/carnithine racemase